jgi:hypothetical protein
MKSVQPSNPEHHDAILSAFGQVLAALVNEVLAELVPKDQSAVAAAVVGSTADIRLVVSLRPYAVMVYLHFPERPTEPLPLATIALPGDPPGLSSLN